MTAEAERLLPAALKPFRSELEQPEGPADDRNRRRLERRFGL